jgi:hypothetical protein
MSIEENTAKPEVKPPRLHSRRRPPTRHASGSFAALAAAAFGLDLRKIPACRLDAPPG